jgi:DmsE family decaheme c-type cytochrome
MTRLIVKMSLLASAALLIMAGTALANEKCATCHSDIAAKHTTTLHGKAGKDCLSCHGGGDVHMANPSKSNIIRFSKGASVKDQNSQCQQCHGKNQKLMFWDNSRHKQEDVACVSCHTVHKNPKPYAKQPDKCFECHKDIKAQANMISHHPIIEGKVSCSDCHNPHGTLGHGMIKADNTNQLCYKCHADKRGPFVWEHPPVEEDCLKCHNTHGTKAQKLLKEKLPNLCQNCHQGNSHPTAMYDKTRGFTGSSPSARLFGRSCVNCHQNIHGTNAPSGKRFIR